jgi:hypothetical protein
VKGISVTFELINKLGSPQSIHIPAGTVFEAARTDYGVQNVVIVKDYRVTLPPYGRQTVTLMGNCLNRRRSYPSSNPGRVTPFLYTGGSLNQHSVWSAMSQPLP